MSKIRISFLIPAYNDQDSIGQVVKEADLVARKIASEYEIRVINDASADNTLDRLQKLKKKYSRLIFSTHDQNAGYGGTIRDLYQSAKYEWLFTIPGDNQIPPAEIEKLLPYTDKSDMIIGWRVDRQDPKARLRQSKIYNTLLRLLYGLNLHDINSVRLMKTKIIKSTNLSTTSAFVDAELAIDATRAGFKISEVPISHRARVIEAGAGGGSLKTILPTIWDMIKYSLERS